MQSSHSLPKNLSWVYFSSGLRDQDAFFFERLQKKWFGTTVCTCTNVTHMHATWDAQRENKPQITHPNLRANLAKGRTEVSVQLRSVRHSSSIPPSHLFSFLSLAVSLFYLKLCPISSFLPKSDFFSYNIIHLRFPPLPSELTPPTHFPIITLSPSFFIPPSFILIHSSPHPPPSCPLAHVLMKQKAPLIAPLLIYNCTERTGQSLKGWANCTFLLIAGDRLNAGEHHTDKIRSKEALNKNLKEYFYSNKQHQDSNPL